MKKTDFDEELKILNKNVTSNKIKHVLVENELNELWEKVKAISKKGLAKDLINKFSILNGAKYFSSGIFQNYLVFMLAKTYTTYFGDATQIDLWKTKKMPEENIENRTKSDSNFARTIFNHHILPDINFNWLDTV